MSTQIRRGVYYSRLRVPTDLQPLLCKREVVRSLNTSSYKAANLLAVKWEAHVAELFVQLRDNAHAMTKQQIQTLVNDYMRSTLDECEDERVDGEISQQKYEGVTLAIGDRLETNNLDLVFNRLDRISSTADELLEQHGVELDRSTIEYKRLCRELLKAEQQVWRIEARRWEGDYSDELVVMSAGVAAGAAEEEPQPLLSEVIAEFERQKQVDGSWTPRTATMYKAGLALFLDVIGDMPIDKVSKQDIRKYQEVLLKLPANMSKRFPGKSAREVLEQEDTSGLPKLSMSSVDKYLRYVKGVFNWAKDNDYIVASPADALKLRNPGTHDEQREAFTDEHLKTIFSNGYEAERDKRPDRYWIPLIMLFTGARLEEAAQLAVGELKEVDGIWCLDINEEGEGKSLKNPHSKRIVPLHSWLIEHGLLEYHQQMVKQGSERLWPKLNKTANGYGSAISKWFNGRLRELGISDKRLVLYSTRHTVATRLKYADVQDHTIAELLGHNESPRLYRRLHFLRGWSYEQINEILAGDTGTGGADGIRASGGI